MFKVQFLIGKVMLKLTKMLSLAGTLMVLGSINSAQGAVIGEPPVVNPNNGNPVEEITGLQPTFRTFIK